MNNHLSLIRGSLSDAGILNHKPNMPGSSGAAIHFNIVPLNTGELYPGIIPGHRFLNRYELFLFTHGTGKFEAGAIREDITRGSVLCINPGCSFTLTAHELQGYHISFSADFFKGTDVTAIPLLFKLLYHSCHEPFTDTITDDGLEDLIAVTVSMQKECAAPREMSRAILQGLFFVFMTYLSCASKPVKKSAFCDRSFEYTSHFITLVRTHYRTHKQVADYARMMCMTPSFLNNIIKKKTGRTASHHIYNFIVLEAKKKAAFTTASMKEIAYELGFMDIYHFSKFFKKNSGLNFSNFRKELTGPASTTVHDCIPVNGYL